MVLLLALLAPSTAHAVDRYVCAVPGTCSLTLECGANPASCYLTVQAAITAASDNDRILLSDETYNEAIVNDAGATGLVIIGDVGGSVINATNNDDGVKFKAVDVTLQNLTITTPGGATRRCLLIENSAASTLDGVTITGCTKDQGAGLHAKNATVTITGATFSDNHATGNGGGHVWCEGCTLDVDGTTFTGGTSATVGAGIRINGSAGVIDIAGSTFENNVASTQGGAIRALTGTLVVTGSTFTGNAATSSSGGAVSTLAPTTIDGCTFTDNTATIAGAVEVVSGTTADILASSFIRNIASGDAGAIWAAGTVSISDSTFDGNEAGDQGGAVECDTSGSLTIATSTFLDNVALDQGGAVSCVSASLCTLTDNTFVTNTADEGGAVSVQASDGYLFVRNTFCQNEADVLAALDRRGGAIHSFDTDGTLLNNVFLENASAGTAGAMMLDGGTVTTTNNHWVANSSSQSGGALEVLSGTLVSTNDLFWLNEGTLDAVHNLGGTLDVRYAWFGANLTTDSNGTVTDALYGSDPVLAGYIPGDCDPANLMPVAGSPLLDAGDPNILDQDGRPSDIGAFGGPDAPPCEDLDYDGFCDPPAAATPTDTGTPTGTTTPGGTGATGTAPGTGTEPGTEAPGGDTDPPTDADPADTAAPATDPTTGGRTYDADTDTTTTTAPTKGGCGCSTSPARVGWVAILALFGARRRR